MIRLAIMKTDPLEFFPLHKSDVANARALLALGYPALGPHLKELLEWLQDGNWPISRPIGEFLLTVPEAIAPLIQEVLASEDHQWKYWCIVRLIGEMKPKVAEPFRFELLRLAECPTLAETQNELDKEALGALQKLWPDDWRLDLRSGELASWAQDRIDNEQHGNGSKPPPGGRMSFPEVLADLQSRPGMFLRKVTYDSVASCIQGFDLGTGFEFLKGFKEWLCSRATQGHNMGWPVLVLYIAFPESKTPWRNLEDPESEQQAIATLFQCLRDFCSER